MFNLELTKKGNCERFSSKVLLEIKYSMASFTVAECVLADYYNVNMPKLVVKSINEALSAVLKYTLEGLVGDQNINGSYQLPEVVVRVA